MNAIKRFVTGLRIRSLELRLHDMNECFALVDNNDARFAMTLEMIDLHDQIDQLRRSLCQ